MFDHGLFREVWTGAIAEGDIRHAMQYAGGRCGKVGQYANGNWYAELLDEGGLVIDVIPLGKGKG